MQGWMPDSYILNKKRILYPEIKKEAYWNKMFNSMWYALAYLVAVLLSSKSQQLKITYSLKIQCNNKDENRLKDKA